jgi:hypothetical protein
MQLITKCQTVCEVKNLVSAIMVAMDKQSKPQYNKHLDTVTKQTESRHSKLQLKENRK